MFPSLARYTFSISLFELLSPLCCGGRLRILDRDEVLTPERLLRRLGGGHRSACGSELARQPLPLHPCDAVCSAGAHRHAPCVVGRRPRRSGGDGGHEARLSERGALRHLRVHGDKLHGNDLRDPSRREGQPHVRRQAVSRRHVAGARPTPESPSLRCGRRDLLRGKRDRARVPRPSRADRERFVDIEGRRFYQTGDMGRLHPDGNLEILGRHDLQVQLRGIRIELAGIERTALGLGLAIQCAVVARRWARRRSPRGVRREAQGVDRRVFPRRARRRAPRLHASPSRRVLDGMPLTVNGKLD